ncbi:MAG: M20 family metallopeptidase [Cyclobacteriaceae bacterium]|nr:amidohydrolase [Cyclobacteriaceae bacterium]MCH8515984.1 M20 family metallopeptidase [Cyclobacteriaceae bacterium]
MDSQIKEKIHQLSESHFSTIQGWRHHLHQYPELSFQEHETMAFVAGELQKIGLEYETGVADTGIVAFVRGKNPDSKVRALRADMDALPITEANEVSYKSTKPGLMHACGHDVHTSCMLGAAKILHELRDHWEGTVKLIFQPGEETAPGGASLMIKAGALENPRPDYILGQHVMPLIPVGKVGFRKGMYMASADEIYMTVKGKGGHGAMPEINVDPVLVTSHLIVALQQIVSRNLSPKVPAVLSFGKVIAQGATNVIPNEVYVEGTFRTMDEEWRAIAHEKITKLVHGLAESMGATVDLEIRKGYPFLKNEPELTEQAIQAAQFYLGEENVVDLDLWMAAEDFSYYSQETDACFYRLGTRNEAKGITSSVHTPTFDIDEDALKIGAGLMAWLAINDLQKD